jgi:hypothetical protein
MDESVGSSFEVRFLTVDGKPLTVIGPTEAIAALERLLGEAPEIELHRQPAPEPPSAA